MFTLNKNYLYLATFIFITASTGVYLTGSSSSGGSSNDLSKETVNAGNQIIDAAPEEDENEKGHNRKAKDRQTTRILFDGSQYILMKDNFGNKTELRYFKPTTSVKYISLKTLSNGTNTMLLGTWDGSLKRLKSSVITNPWGSTAGEIAVLTGVSTVYKPQPEEPHTRRPSVIKPSQITPLKPGNQNVNTNAGPKVKPTGTPSSPTNGNTNQQTVTGN